MSILSPDNPGTSLGDVRQLPAQRIEAIFNLTDWVEEIFPNNTFLGGETHERIRGVCQEVLTANIAGYGIRYWDLAILLPNLLFLLFLICKLGVVMRKVQKTKSPVFKAFFALIYISTVLNILRCVISISISTTNQLGDLIDKVLWLCVKSFFMTAELSVLAFGLLFGHMDSASSVRRALFVSLLVSLSHSAVQTVLEFKLLDKDLIDESGVFDLHSHGGLAFWAISSAVFALVYIVVLCLPMTCIRNYVTLPSKGSFLLYCTLLSFLNFLQSIGATLLFFDLVDGICLVDVTTFIYFTIFTPIVYFTFIRRTLNCPPNSKLCSNYSTPVAKPTGGLFSYRQQKDERGTGDMQDSYYPRFSGLQSPSYDDLFEATRDIRFPYPYDAPLMLNDTAESTVTTRTGSDNDYERSSRFDSLDRGPRQLKGLGPSGTLVFNDDEPYPPSWGYQYS